MAIGNNFVDNNPDDLNSAAEREQYFGDMLTDPDLTKYDVDVISMRLGDTGNEAALSSLDNAADVSGGQLGKMNTLERDVDQSNLRVQGSLSKNLSDGEQVNHEKMEHSGYPVVQGADDMNPAIAAMYMALNMFGISRGQLTEALAANGPDDDRATLSSFYEMAEEANLGKLMDYIQDTDGFAAHFQVEAGMKDVAPVVGTEPEPTATTAETELALAQQLEQQAEMSGMGAPSAPTAPSGPR
tara:strand:+ start:539 stop:1264 length:726 start_codon:yes stop_codon:yes gene_type:complete